MTQLFGSCSRDGSWLARLRARKPKMLVAIALATKMARQLRAMITKQEDYRDPTLAAAASSKRGAIIGEGEVGDPMGAMIERI